MGIFRGDILPPKKQKADPLREAGFKVVPPSIDIGFGATYRSVKQTEKDTGFRIQRGGLLMRRPTSGGPPTKFTVCRLPDPARIDRPVKAVSSRPAPKSRAQKAGEAAHRRRGQRS